MILLPEDNSGLLILLFLFVELSVSSPSSALIFLAHCVLLHSSLESSMLWLHISSLSDWRNWLSKILFDISCCRQEINRYGKRFPCTVSMCVLGVVVWPCTSVCFRYWLFFYSTLCNICMFAVFLLFVLIDVFMILFRSCATVVV